MSKLAVTIEGQQFEIELDLVPQMGPDIIVHVNGQPIPVTIPNRDISLNGIEWLIVGERSYDLAIDRDLHWIRSHKGIHHVEVRDLEATVIKPRSRDGRVKAPIPGLVTRILVEIGQAVSAGDTLLVLEAMKMENQIRAPRDGTVATLHVEPGQSVARNEVLAEIR
ncbi:MAG: biotin/lipoyl-binding protein [Chloroflexi bacterium]|nr:biotin/lipoyl-binding protein [Chloroflexota bacterium]